MHRQRSVRAAIAAGLLALLPSGSALAADPATTTTCRGTAAVCALIVAGERALAAMPASGDTSPIGRLFADDAIWSLASGRQWTKIEAIRAIGRMPRAAHSRLARAEVRQFGDVAIVRWEERRAASAANEEALSLGIDTWLRRSGRWQIIASQESEPR